MPPVGEHVVAWENRSRMIRDNFHKLRTLPGRGRQRDKTDVFADESGALDEIAKQVSSISNSQFIPRQIFCILRCDAS